MSQQPAVQSASPGSNQHPGRLLVVATPIGNLGDISPRACATLAQADLIACEDTRHTGNLCRHLGISTPLISYYREKEQQRAEQLLQHLLAGKDVALVSDAGTPGISDPGGVLVAAARAAGIVVQAVAGPSALTAALSIAGRRETRFFFGGFLPAARAQRRASLRELVTLPWALVFYEAPHRIKATLADLQEVLGDRPAQLFRELTKIHEECRQGTLSELIEGIGEGGLKGEIVLLVTGASSPASARPEELDELLRWHRDELGASVKDAVAAIAADLSLPRGQVYRKALALWNERHEKLENL